MEKLEGPLAFNYVVSVDTKWKNTELKRKISDMFKDRLLKRNGIGNTYNTSLKDIYCSDNSCMKNGVWCSQGKKSDKYRYTYIYYVSFIVNPSIGLVDAQFKIEDNKVTSTHSEWHRLGERVIQGEEFKIDENHTAVVKDYRGPKNNDYGFNMDCRVESVGTEGIDTTMINEDRGFENTVDTIKSQQELEQAEPDADANDVIDQFSSVVNDSLKKSVREKLLKEGAVRLRGPTESEMDSTLDMVIEIIESVTSKELTYLKEKPEEWSNLSCSKCGYDTENEMFIKSRERIREEIRNYMIELNGLHERDIYLAETSENANDFLVDIDTGEIVFKKSMYFDLMTDVSNIVEPMCRDCHIGIKHSDYADDQFILDSAETEHKSVSTDDSDNSSRFHYPVDNRMNLSELRREIYVEIAKRLTRGDNACQEDLIRPEIDRYINSKNRGDEKCLISTCDSDVSCDETMMDLHHMNPLNVTKNAIEQTFSLEGGDDCTVYINSETRDIVFTQEAIREIEKIVENMNASTLFCNECLGR